MQSRRTSKDSMLAGGTSGAVPMPPGRARAGSSNAQPRTMSFSSGGANPLAKGRRPSAANDGRRASQASASGPEERRSTIVIGSSVPLASASPLDGTEGKAAGQPGNQAGNRGAAELDSSLVRDPNSVAFISQDEIGADDVWRAKWLRQYRKKHEADDRGDLLARYQAPTSIGHTNPAPTVRQAVDISLPFDRRLDHLGRTRAEAQDAARAGAASPAGRSHAGFGGPRRAGDPSAPAPPADGKHASTASASGASESFPPPAMPPGMTPLLASIHEDEASSSPSDRSAVRRRASKAQRDASRGWTGHGGGSDSDSSSEYHDAAAQEAQASMRRGTGSVAIHRRSGPAGNPPVDTMGRFNRWQHERDFGTYELEVDGQAVRRRLVTRSGDVYTREVSIDAPQLFEIEEVHRTAAQVAQEKLYACANSGCVRYVRSQPLYVVACVGVLAVLYTLTLFGLPGLKLRSAAVTASYLLAFLVALPVCSSGAWRCCFDCSPEWRVWCRDRFRTVGADTDLDPCCGCGFGCLAERLGCHWCCACCAGCAGCCRGLAYCCPGGYEVAGFSDANLAWVAFVIESWYGPSRPPSRLGGSNRKDLPYLYDLDLRRQAIVAEASRKGGQADDGLQEVRVEAARREADKSRKEAIDEEVEREYVLDRMLFPGGCGGTSLATLVFLNLFLVVLLPALSTCSFCAADAYASPSQVGSFAVATPSATPVPPAGPQCRWGARYYLARLGCEYIDPIALCPGDTAEFSPDVPPVMRTVHELRNPQDDDDAGPLSAEGMGGLGLYLDGALGHGENDNATGASYERAALHGGAGRGMAAAGAGGGVAVSYSWSQDGSGAAQFEAEHGGDRSGYASWAARSLRVHGTRHTEFGPQPEQPVCRSLRLQAERQVLAQGTTPYPTHSPARGQGLGSKSPPGHSTPDGLEQWVQERSSGASHGAAAPSPRGLRWSGRGESAGASDSEPILGLDRLGQADGDGGADASSGRDGKPGGSSWGLVSAAVSSVERAWSGVRDPVGALGAAAFSCMRLVRSGWSIAKEGIAVGAFGLELLRAGELSAAVNPWGVAWDTAIAGSGALPVFGAGASHDGADSESYWLQNSALTSAAMLGGSHHTEGTRGLQAGSGARPHATGGWDGSNPVSGSNLGQGGGEERLRNDIFTLPAKCDKLFRFVDDVRSTPGLDPDQATAFTNVLSIYNEAKPGRVIDRIKNVQIDQITESYASVLASAVPGSNDFTCQACRRPAFYAYLGCYSLSWIAAIVLLLVMPCLGLVPMLPIRPLYFYPRPQSVLHMYDSAGIELMTVDLGDYRNCESAIRFIRLRQQIMLESRLAEDFSGWASLVNPTYRPDGSEPIGTFVTGTDTAPAQHALSSAGRTACAAVSDVVCCRLAGSSLRGGARSGLALFCCPCLACGGGCGGGSPGGIDDALEDGEQPASTTVGGGALRAAGEVVKAVGGALGAGSRSVFFFDGWGHAARTRSSVEDAVDTLIRGIATESDLDDVTSALGAVDAGVVRRDLQAWEGARHTSGNMATQQLERVAVAARVARAGLMPSLPEVVKGMRRRELEEVDLQEQLALPGGLARAAGLLARRGAKFVGGLVRKGLDHGADLAQRAMVRLESAGEGFGVGRVATAFCRCFGV